MTLIIGLGNPGKKFEKMRHNIGFRVIDELSNKNNFSQLKMAKKFLAEISEGQIDDKKIILAKPQTFMNDSGRAVKLLTKHYPLNHKNLIVVHDDIDLPLDKIKISARRGAAGHKGVESIIKELGTKDFVRVRIGIKSKDNEQKARDFVLKKFKKEEEKILKRVIKKSLDLIEMTVRKGVEKAMAKFN